MKAKITLTFDVESNEYLFTEPTEEGIKELVQAMLDREADFPDDIDIEVTEI